MEGKQCVIIIITILLLLMVLLLLLFLLSFLSSHSMCAADEEIFGFMYDPINTLFCFLFAYGFFFRLGFCCSTSSPLTFVELEFSVVSLSCYTRVSQ